MLSETSQTVMISLTCGLLKTKQMNKHNNTENKLLAAKQRNPKYKRYSMGNTVDNCIFVWRHHHWTYLCDQLRSTEITNHCVV